MEFEFGDRPVVWRKKLPDGWSNGSMLVSVVAVTMLLLQFIPNTGGYTPSSASEGAYFQFDYPPNPETFVFKLTDPARIQEARDILAGKIMDKVHVMGTIVKEPAFYNPPWSYQLNSSTISFFEISIEVCDATIRYVEDHLSEVGESFLPNNVWCPWGSRLLQEIKIPSDFTLGASPDILLVARDSSEVSVITIAPVGDFVGVVTVTATITPVRSHTPGVSLDPTSVNVCGPCASFVAPTSILTVTALKNATKGIYVITVTGTSGTISHSVTVTATITTR